MCLLTAIAHTKFIVSRDEINGLLEFRLEVKRARQLKSYRFTKLRRGKRTLQRPTHFLTRRTDSQKRRRRCRIVCEVEPKWVSFERRRLDSASSPSDHKDYKAERHREIKRGQMVSVCSHPTGIWHCDHESWSRVHPQPNCPAVRNSPWLKIRRPAPDLSSCHLRHRQVGAPRVCIEARSLERRPASDHQLILHGQRRLVPIDQGRQDGLYPLLKARHPATIAVKSTHALR